MIRRVRLGSFKCSRDQSFELGDSIVLAEPNNAKKSTLLQVMATWKFGLDLWLAQRKGDSKGVKRTGVAFTGRDPAMPIRKINLLWKDRVAHPEVVQTLDRIADVLSRGIRGAFSS